LSKEEVKGILEREFSDYRRFEVKMVKHDGDQDIFAYVNFDEPGCAKDIRRTKITQLKKLLGNRVCLDPTGVVRDQEGKYIPDRYNRSLMDRRERSPERDRERRRSPVHRRSPVIKVNNEVPTRTLFVGNLSGYTTEREIREAFERYGRVEDVEIKQADGGNASYAFVLFCSIRDAQAARRALDGDTIGRESNRKCKIGFGKAQPSKKLWVGDLGPWATASMLEKEFDRYGPIEDLDYKEGDEFAYVTFADNQAAADAFKGMQDFVLDKGHRISVDYAKMTPDSRKRRRSESLTRSSPKRSRGPRTPPPPDRSRSSSNSRPLSKSENGSPKITTIQELQKQKAATWKGSVTLKKTDYPISLHRISGSEDILQDYLRDDEGRALKLVLNQRLPLDDNLFEKIVNFDESEIAVAFAVERERDRPVESLLAYLKEKKAAGVVSSNSVITYLLVHSPVTQRLVHHFNQDIDIPAGYNYFFVVIKKV